MQKTGNECHYILGQSEKFWRKIPVFLCDIWIPALKPYYHKKVNNKTGHNAQKTYVKIYTIHNWQLKAIMLWWKYLKKWARLLKSIQKCKYLPRKCA